MTRDVLVRETALHWHVEGDWVPGILAEPDALATSTTPRLHRDIGVVVVVGGPQYRVGSHRQFVLLARHLAAHGYPVLRFDLRGSGDAQGKFSGFESIHLEIDAAIEALYRHAAGVRRHVLWGLCDAASAILMRAAPSPHAHLAGVCVLNPWVRTAQSLDRAHIQHYYRRRIFEADFWRKLMHGGVGLGALREWAAKWRRVRSPHATQSLSFIEQMNKGWRALSGQILLITSEFDLTGQEFLDLVRAESAWNGALAPDVVRHIAIAGADHTFSRADWRDAVASATLAWLDDLAQPTPAEVPRST